jgi:hypothetical protein
MVLLTAGNVFRYLCDLGFASPQEVVNREFRVSNLSRRNTAFKVSCRSRPDYVVKQVKDWTQENIAVYETELQWYQFARQHPSFAPVAEFLANCRRWDEANRIVILELPREYEALDQHFVRIGRFPVPVAKMLGETLGALHRALSHAELKEMRQHFHDVKPFGLSFVLRDEIPPSQETPAYAELHRFVLSNPVFRGTFKPLSEFGRKDVLINCDMKFAHCILTGARPTAADLSLGPKRRGAHLHFIDWELAGFGDPSWDVSAIFQEYLFHWLASIPGGPSGSYEEYADRALFPLEETRAAIGAFWRSYADAADLLGQAAEEMLDRSVSCTAAWLIQMAYQSLANAETMHALALGMAQLSVRILNLPPAERRELLGL